LREISGISRGNTIETLQLHQTTEMYELDMIKNGLDSSLLLKQKWDLINNLVVKPHGKNNIRM
jgi:hypothetical protein